MRPVSIELEGFSAYREPVTVEFTGVDFFSITGPTGSGKSSLIDAMVFALYGRVPRLGGNAVAPAITAGADRARVRFDFEVSGTAYTAVRLAQRTPTGGAAVKEARLQEGDSVLASGADDVSAAVEELLKLRFDDFTRTVVLPQGEFARFLTATRAERQGLLRSLLGMDVYTAVRELARTRAAVAGERAEGASRTLANLEVADEKEMKSAVERRDALAALAEAIPDREKTLQHLESAVAESEARVGKLEDAITRLAGIEEPARLAELDALIVAARSRLVDATSDREAAVEELKKAESAAKDLPSADQIVGWRKGWENLDEVIGRLDDSEAVPAAKHAEETKKELDHGLSRLQAKREELERTRSDHAAHVLSATLEVGQPCPVCAGDVTELPDRPAPRGLENLQNEVSGLSEVVESLRKEAEEARDALTRIQTARVGLAERREALGSELEGAPTIDVLDVLEKKLGDVATAVEEARTRIEERETAEEAAGRALEDLTDDSRRIAKLFREAERSVHDLDPPLSESDDAVVQWKDLIIWRDETLDGVRTEFGEAEEATKAAREEALAGHQALVAILDDHGVEASEPYSVQVATALQTARALVDAQEKAANDAITLKQQADEASAEAAVAETLANHLRANGFEQWLMAGALNDLVSGANELLGQLSGDGYSLHSDDSGSFSIVDHRNADEMRSVSTLSGGETFLVSLALALSLAETLAAKGGSGLDAIILDEGFGTLDDESLDIVASVLEELSGHGLMVGIITHVKELAARAPVRYEVQRGPGGASVRRLS